MSYVVAYSTFANLSRGNFSFHGKNLFLTFFGFSPSLLTKLFCNVEIDVLMEESTSDISFETIDPEPLSSEKKSLHLLDLYSGCGGMSTGLCLGAALSGVNLETVSSFLLQYAPLVM